MVSLQRLALAILFWGLTTHAHAALIAQVSQQHISEGDSLTLVLTANDRISDEAPDFAPLTRDFVILNRQQSQNTSYINGKRSSNTTWQLSLLAKSTGDLTIPSLQLGNERSRPIAIKVKPAPKNQTVPNSDSVLIESSLNRDTVYLGGQSLLTVKILHRGNLISASLSEPQSDQAIIEQTHESSYQRSINGTPVAVIERVYAIFPEAEGTINISGQTLTAELAMGSQRSIFGYTNTKTTRRVSQSKTLSVLPLPSFAHNKDTVTADKLQIEQQWSQALDSLSVGDSLTRTLTISATGATGAQIPPLFLDDIDGIKIYGDQPEINDIKNQLGVVGKRIESTAYVLTQAGTFEIPAVVLHWVNAQTGKVQSVSLPSTQLNVKAALAEQTNVPPTSGNEQLTTSVNPTAEPQAASGLNALSPWFYVSLALFALWLITLIFALRLKYGSKAKQAPANTAPLKDDLYKQLLRAAKANDASQTLALFKQWGQTLDASLNSNHQICDYLNDDHISKSIERAERSLYQAKAQSAWNGTTLATHLQQWHKNNAKRTPTQLAPLY